MPMMQERSKKNKVEESDISIGITSTNDITLTVFKGDFEQSVQMTPEQARDLNKKLQWMINYADGGQDYDEHNTF